MIKKAATNLCKQNDGNNHPIVDSKIVVAGQNSKIKQTSRKETKEITICKVVAMKSWGSRPSGLDS